MNYFSYIKKYIKNTIEIVKKENILFFTIIVLSLQIISTFLKPYNIDIYQVTSIVTIYNFINLQTTIYNILMSSVISTFISYFIYKWLLSISKKINILLLNVITFISVTTCMLFLNCFSITSLAYISESYISIPTDGINYISSFIISKIIIILLCILLLFTIKTFNKYIIKNNVNYSNYKQLEKNISNINK
jgi:hypothetical protein